MRLFERSEYLRRIARAKGASLGDHTALEEGMTFHGISAIWLDTCGIVVSESFIVTEQGGGMVRGLPAHSTRAALSRCTARGRGTHGKRNIHRPGFGTPTFARRRRMQAAEWSARSPASDVALATVL